MKPLISVIIPVYNAEEYLSSCVDSVTRQTYKNLEIIVIDDKSVDHSMDIIERKSEKDNRIKIIRNEKNKGLYLSRKRGIKEAKGKYISFIDADDLMGGGMIEMLFDNLIKTNSDIAEGGHISFEKNIKKELTEEKKEIVCLEGEELILNYVSGKGVNVIHGNWSLGVVWNKLYKRRILLELDIPDFFTFGEDRIFNLRVFERVKRAVFISDKLYFYRLTPYSATINLKKTHLRNNIFVSKNFYEKFQQISKNTTLSKEYLSSGFSAAIDSFIKLYMLCKLKEKRENDKVSLKDYLREIIEEIRLIRKDAKKEKVKLHMKWRLLSAFLIYTRTFYDLIMVKIWAIKTRKERLTASLTRKESIK
ncbi:MAG: glycosyltransferase family 2 protein [Clostridiales Family XIII bacterium]|jgi:glycosyltransferase involved in cell wall biosynthesis|nr:glycosyltransferase family 2 protein [Clostridiales Family XIII bacterium]